MTCRKVKFNRRDFFYKEDNGIKEIINNIYQIACYCAEQYLIKYNIEKKELYQLKLVIPHEGKPEKELQVGAWKVELIRRPG